MSTTKKGGGSVHVSMSLWRIPNPKFNHCTAVPSAFGCDV